MLLYLVCNSLMTLKSIINKIMKTDKVLPLSVSLCAFFEIMRIKVVNEHSESCNCNVIKNHRR